MAREVSARKQPRAERNVQAAERFIERLLEEHAQTDRRDRASRIEVVVLLLRRMLEIQPGNRSAMMALAELNFINENYETLEAIGDAALDVTFKKYAVRRFPKITSNVLSEYKSRYMSKEFQGEWARMIGLDKWIITGDGIPPTVAMHTDVFESLIGALDAVSDDMFYGTGMINIMNYITLLFNDVIFDPNMVYGNYKTVAIQQYSQLFKWDDHHVSGGIKTRGIRVDTNEEKNGEHTSTVYLSKNALNFLKDLGLREKNPFITSSGKTAQESEANAYEATVKKLISLGLNRDYINAYRMTAPFNKYNPSHKDAIMNANGVAQMKYSIIRKASTPDRYVVQLIGTKPNGERVLLSTGVERTEDLARDAAFRQAYVATQSAVRAQ